MKTIVLGSKVTVEVYLGKVKYDGNARRKHLEYERFRKDEDYKEVYIICDLPKTQDIREISFNSFIGRAFMGAMVGWEVEVDVGGLSIGELRVGSLSGNYLRFKILSID